MSSPPNAPPDPGGADDEVRAAVRATVAAAARVADRADGALERALVSSTGLSPEGVRFALERALERSPSEAELSQLLASVRPAAAVAVVLAANVFTAALRAICLARAAAPRVIVRPSRRDPHFARALVDELADPAVTLVDVVPPLAAGAVVHAYGRDESVAAIARAGGVPVWAHGAGLGVAVVSEGAHLADAGAALAEDLVAFDQRGCLSPRVAFVAGGAARARAFAEHLAGALEVWAGRVPLGALSPAERADLARARDTALLCGEVLGERGGVTAVTEIEEDVPCIFFPPGRNLAIVPVRDLEEARRRVDALGRSVVSASGSELGAARGVAPPWARLTRLGRAQRPPLDGPVNRRDLWL